MATEIQNKVAVVTGGAKGIGYAISEAILKQGAKIVFIIDIDEELGTRVAEQLNLTYGDGKVIFLKGDVTKDLDKVYNKIVVKVKNIDILVNNAGVFDEISIRRTLEINTLATVEWSMKFYENMRKDKGGSGGTILNIASVSGYQMDQFAPFYKTSKWAVMGFSRTLGHEENFKGTGVSVKVLCPGATKTNILENVKYSEVFSFHEYTFQDFMNSVPLQEKEDVATAAVEIVKNGESGSAWSIIGGELQQLP